jgi:ABC-type multidrug transport system fused ATPase/permease subunit
MHTDKKKLTLKDLLGAMKVALSFVGERKFSSAKLIALAFLSAGLGALIPLLVGRFIDALVLISDRGFSETFWLYPLLGWFGVVFASNIIDWRLSVLSRREGTFVHAKASSQWSSELLLLPLAFHKQKKKGEVTSKVSRGSSYVSTLIESILLGIGPALLSMVIGLAFAFALQPHLALGISIGMALYGFVSVWNVLPLAQLQRDGNKALHEAYGDAHDAIYNVQSVKQAGAEYIQARRNERNYLYTVLEKRMLPEVRWARIRFTQRTFVIVTQLGVFLGSVYFVSTGSMSVGDLVALNGYTALVFGPLAQLANNWNTIQNGLTTIHDVQEILSTGPEAYDRPSGITPPQWDGAVVFDRVTFAYPDATDRTVLDDVSFIIKDGQTVAFVGESGVGKSTVTELIGGYYYPTEGEVLVSGVKTTEVPLRALREHIAVVPQEPALFNDTVLNNIRFGREQASDEEVIAAAKQAFAHEFIESFPEKYQQVVGERGVRLSVGQKQRIAIARAILRDPRILILDEPTSALDAKTEAYIAESLKALMKGRTTIVIAHRLSTVRSADNIIVFEQGKVVEQGTHAELLERTAGVYRTLHEHQVGLHT